MISPNGFLFLGFFAVLFILYFWQKTRTDQWRKPLILVGGIAFIFLGYYFILNDIYTEQLKTDSKFFYTAIISVCIGGFVVYIAYSKRKDQIQNAWRLPLVFIGGIVLIMFGTFLLGVMFFSISYASLFVGVIGIVEILISLKISHTRNSVKWLFPLSLIGGLITFVFGIITYFLFTTSII
ncbi:hypothetical protein [Brumimicrobium oceani]|uniref:Uncharacterized protein n=1 Tax=Brumimicrobium oceani TaxID=2100725 RepID=A0A2U2XE95_9FLAO|nr:hypothetical protein [Brumimicrobium oceani]PWH86021.1 hypothetical protein DIT68_05555 [Brumimicrobium oceani]